MRRFLLLAGSVLLALSVLTLSTEARAALYPSAQHLSRHCKATDTSECRLKAQPPVAVCQLLWLEPAAFTSEILPLELDVLPGSSAWISPSHPLRAPPAS